MSFFAELKRRNVIRAATSYAASAWLLVQVASQVFPIFHIAEWVVRLIVVSAIIGFPFAMLFAWFYELTPAGIRRESEVDPCDVPAFLRWPRYRDAGHVTGPLISGLRTDPRYRQFLLKLGPPPPASSAKP